MKAAPETGPLSFRTVRSATNAFSSDEFYLEQQSRRPFENRRLCLTTEQERKKRNIVIHLGVAGDVRFGPEKHMPLLFAFKWYFVDLELT
jgi:hypothetical protein